MTQLDVLHDPPEALTVVTVAEHVRMLVRRGLPRTHRQQQRVVEQLTATAGMHYASVRVDPHQAVSNPPRPCVRRDPRQRIAANALKRERLEHRQRPADELLLRADERQLDAVASQPTQAQETFDTGDPATADQHVQTGGHSFRSLVADIEKGTKLHWIRSTGATASKPPTLRTKDRRLMPPSPACAFNRTWLLALPGVLLRGSRC